VIIAIVINGLFLRLVFWRWENKAPKIHCSPFHPLPIFFHFLPPIWFFRAGTFLLFLFSSTFFLLPFGFPVLVPFCPTTFFYFVFLPPRCRYYFLLFCFHSTALRSTLCFSVCVYQWCVSITDLEFNLFMLKCLTCRSVLGLCVSV